MRAVLPALLVWQEIGWPAEGSAPRAFVAFEGGVLIGGHRGLMEGIVHFERGGERCTFAIPQGRVNDMVVHEEGKAWRTLSSLRRGLDRDRMRGLRIGDR